MSAAAKCLLQTTDFPRVGERTYVQGITIFQTMADALSRELNAAEIDVSRCKFKNKCLHNGAVYLTPMASEALPKQQTAVMTVEGADGGHIVSFVADPDSPVQRGISDHDYEIHDFESDGAFSGSATLVAPDYDMFMLHLIEFNKRIVAAGVAGSREPYSIELVELEDFHFNPADCPSETRVSAINVSTRQFGRRLYALSEIRYLSDSQKPCSTRFNFSAEPLNT